MTADAGNHVHVSVPGFIVQQDHSEKHLFKVCMDIDPRSWGQVLYIAKVCKPFPRRRSLQGARPNQMTAAFDEALASVFRCFQSLLLDLFAAIHGQSCNGVRGQNHNGAPHKMRGGSSWCHTHRPAGISRIWDAHVHCLAAGLHVCSGRDEKSLRTADRCDQCMDTRAGLFIRLATTASRDTSDPEWETPDCVNRMRNRYPCARSCRREDLNALSSLETRKAARR